MFYDRDCRSVAFLIGFAVPDMHSEARRVRFKILNVERNELGAAKGAGKAEQQEGAVAEVFQPLSRSNRHGNNPFAGGWHLAVRRHADDAPRAAHRRLHALVVGWRRMTGKLVEIADRGEAVAERRRSDFGLDLRRQKGRY